MQLRIRNHSHFAVLAALLVLPMQACSEAKNDPGYGPNPVLPAVENSLLPTVNIADATGWKEGVMPTPAAGLKVSAYARNLQHPRWLYVLPNGDVLVAESDAPPKPEDNKGIKGAIMKKVMKKAGSLTPSGNRITLLRGQRSDGSAVVQTTFLEKLNSPIGMALVGNQLYVANTDALLRFPYKEGDTRIVAKSKKIADLPGGPINHHWTKNVIASKDGKTLFVAVGSNSNVAERGIVAEKNRAAILAIDAESGNTRVFASGLRNPVGMDWNPRTGALWTVVNERDDLGNNLVPDYLTSVQEGGFYGWPYSYYGQHVDQRVEPPRPDLVARAIVPDYALGNHTASLGLVFNTGERFPEHYRQGAFIGQHGSWNRKPKSGYKVVFVPFAEGKPNGMPEDVLTGFLDAEENAQGRPVGVAIAKDGALLVADDVGNTVWRVEPEQRR